LSRRRWEKEMVWFMGKLSRVLVVEYFDATVWK
jgi:hypothetical protein